MCVRLFGEQSILASRLFTNIGIYYDCKKDYTSAFNYFRKWAAASEHVFGAEHPKTRCAKRILSAPRYTSMAD
jgi:hypothetical protein